MGGIFHQSNQPRLGIKRDTTLIRLVPIYFQNPRKALNYVAYCQRYKCEVETQRIQSSKFPNFY
jgi:hypothetical protein